MNERGRYDKRNQKDRAGVIPYVLYFIYTVYMVVAAVYLNGQAG